MKISLFQGILLGVFGLCALIGLFVFATYSGKSTSSNAIGTVVIWGTLPSSSMDAVLATTTQSNKELKNVSYVQKDPATLPAELASAIATGNSPDLILDSQENLFSLAKFITPIPSATLPASTFSSAFVNEGSLLAASDGYYGVPFLVDPLVLFSNRAILSSDGIARPPASWEALTGLVPNVALLTSSRQISRGLIALGAYDNVRNARAIVSSLFLQTGVPISSYASNGLMTADLGMNSSSGTPPGQAVLNFYTQFADPSKVSYTWNTSLPDSQQSFLSGDLALYIGYASEAVYFKKANPNLDFAVSPLPQPLTGSTKNAYGLLYSFMISRGAKNPSGAYQVATLFASSDAQGPSASLTGLAPANLGQLAKTPSDPILAVAYSEALYTKGWLSPSGTNVDSVFSSMINSVVSGKYSVTMALSSAESALRALLQ